MGYEAINPGDFGYKGNPFVEAYDASREATRKKEADRWAQIQGQGHLDIQRQQMEQQGAHQKFEEGRQTTADNDAIIKQATELHQAGMPLQAQQLLAMHGYNPMAVTPQATADGTGVPGQEVTKPQGNDDLAPPSPEPVTTPQGSQPSSYEGGGLDHFDVNAAASNLGGVGQPQPSTLSPAPAQVAPQPAPHVETMVSPPTPRILSYRGPGGQNLQIDPMEARRAQQEQNQYRATQYTSAMRGTPLEASSGEFAGLLAAGDNVKAGDVLGLQKADIAAKDRAAKEAAAHEEDLRRRPDVETQSRWQHERNLAIMAGHGGIGGGSVPIDPKVYNAWESHKEHTKAAVLAKNAVQSNATLDRIDAELANNQNPLSQAMAIHSAAALSTSIGASGGRVTVQASRDIKEAYGALDSLENKAYRALNGGSNMPAIIQKAQQAMANLRAVNQHAAQKAYEQFHMTAGMGSPWAQDPALGPHVQAEDEATAAELGVPVIGEQYGDSGEANAPPAHHAKPGHPSHRSAPAAPAAAPVVAPAGPPPGADPGKTLHMNGKELYFDAQGKAL